MTNSKSFIFTSNKAEGHFYLAQAFASLDKWNDAARELKAALRLRPHWTEAWNQLGIALASVNDLKGALVAFERARKLRPTEMALVFNAGRAHYGLQHYEEALSCFRLFEQTSPRHPEIHRWIGLAQAEQGKLDEALIALTKSISLDPRNAEAWDALALIHDRMDNSTEAESAKALAASLRVPFPEEEERSSGANRLPAAKSL